MHNLLAGLVALFLGVGPVCAADDPLAALGLAAEEAEAPLNRAPRPASLIAENVTVVTAADIARLNAHTLADVLQTVPGIQLDYLRTPGSFTFFNIQGALNNTVLVLMDGVRQNDFDVNMAEPGLIPVQQIERIEIVRGAASAAWGSALGGVINIVTKSPDPERPIAGLVSGAIGSQATADTRAELSGTVGRLGYYLTGGNLHSDGLLPNNGANLNHFYGKLSWLLPGDGTLTAGYSYVGGPRGADEGLWHLAFPVRDNEQDRQRRGFLQLAQPLAPRLHLNLLGYLTDVDGRGEWNDLIDGQAVPFSHSQILERSRGVNARLTWGDNRQKLVAGAEYAHAESLSQQIAPTYSLWSDRTWDSYGLYANGTFSFGPLTILPGIRFDHTGLASDVTSYTLGATWQAADQTLLRVYGARGYGLPQPGLQRGLMRVTTLQAGGESTALPGLWLKGTFFYSWLRDIESVGNVTLTDQDRQGVEVEARTVPLFGFALTGGYTYSHVKDADTGERLQTNSQQTVPPHLVKLGLLYDNDDLGLKGGLTGNYVSWNAAADTFARSGGIVWDLHLTWQVLPDEELSPELFFSARNLFDNVQTTSTDLLTNTPRWFEGGLRFKF